MSGIFAILTGKNSPLALGFFQSAAASLLKLSESGGIESCGLAICNSDTINVYKQVDPAPCVVRSKEYKRFFRDPLGENRTVGHPLALIGHSHLVATSAQENNRNNQPIVATGMVGILDGPIANCKYLWDQFSHLEREYEADIEILLRLIGAFRKEGKSPTEAVRSAFSLIRGAASVIVLFEDLNSLLLATTTGALYKLSGKGSDLCIVASDLHRLRMLERKRMIRDVVDDRSVSQIRPGNACWINFADLRTETSSLAPEEHPQISPVVADHPKRLVKLSAQYKRKAAPTRIKAYNPLVNASGDNVDLLFQYQGHTESIRRCTRCVLPETYPFIQFDDEGVCNYCRDHKNREWLGVSALEERLKPYRRATGRPDCLVGFSGGRDSSYCLHYLKTVLGMNPIAYTYDWGMVTDIGFRNASRICGELGIEHIVDRANIKLKRRNIRKNVLAWLKRPELGLIPLFTAGDKQMFFFLNRLHKHTGIDLGIYASGSGFEDTPFRWGFCGIRRRDSLPLSDRLRLAFYYLKKYLENPSYLNISIPDTLFAYYSYYFMSWGDSIRLYEYLRWDEEEILSTITREYGWERDPLTKRTWRIGDATAPFYNYIFYVVSGFTENDTFRSVQIREGMMAREKALRLVSEENKPYYEGIKWYLSALGLGLAFDEVIKTINAMPKLYGT